MSAPGRPKRESRSAQREGKQMNPQLITVAQTPPQAWRNGGGRTRELLAWPTPQDWQLRLSVADIDADGPFSVFDGVQRWFVVLQGEGVALTIDGQQLSQGVADAPLHFDGAATTDCRLLSGPTRDLNLMLRQRPGGLLPAAPGQAWRPPGSVCGLFTRVASQCQFKPSPAAQHIDQALPAMSLLWFDAAPATLCWQPISPDPTPLPQAWWLWAATETPHP